MKQPWLAILALLALAYFPLRAADFEKEFSTTKGKKLEVDLKNGGAISIVGWGKDRVSVKGYREGDAGNECALTMKEIPTGVALRSEPAKNGSDCSIRVEVRVPRRYDLHLLTMGGSISLDSIEGQLTGKTMGGELDLRHLKGTLSLETMGGPITLKDADVDGSVRTMGGEVLIEDVTGDVKGSSMGGNVTLKNVTTRQGEVKGREVNISSMGGDINVDDAPLGADVHTMGGNIHVKSAAHFVKAKTMGGTISLDAVDGSIEATTMGGDVAATMTGNPAQGKRGVTLTSMGGEVTLRVPAALSMRIDVELVYTKENAGRYSITSDFPLQLKESPTWEEDHGTPRKTIHGTGEQAGGTNLVKIKTVNGNVVIKKL